MSQNENVNRNEIKPQAKRNRPRPMMGGGGHGRGFGMPAEKAKDFKGSLKRLLGLLKPQRGLLILITVLTVLASAFSIISPKVLGLITTALYEGVRTGVFDMSYILRILVILGGLYLLSAGFNAVQQVTMTSLAQRTVFGLRQQIEQKLSRLPLKYFDQTPRGDILSRLTNDADNIAGTLQQSVTQLISAVITLVGVLAMMLWISPLMTLVSLIVIPLGAFATINIAKHSQKLFAAQWEATGDLNAHIEEMYTGHSVVRLFGREKEAIRVFEQINQQLYGASWKAQFVSSIMMPVMMLINNIGYVLVCAIGALRVARGAMPLGDVHAFIQYSRQFTQPINQVASIMNVLQSTVASAERVFMLLDEEEQVPDANPPAVLEKAQGNVRFEGVDFSYVPEKPLIKNLNIQVQSGQMVAIVGPTGAGKTTLVNLLMRFYDVDAGTIAVDGVDIRHLTRQDLRSHFGMVLQDAWLFTGTIRDNIAYGKLDATEQEIADAARAAYVHRFVRTLPQGYDTVLEEGAAGISQGQRQLLTIARAMVADPDILILDEATSSVDTRTEVLIQRAMARLMKGRTSFVIAHRLSTIRSADCILVMKEGAVVEQGTHEELMEKDGFYAELYNSQFAKN